MRQIKDLIIIIFLLIILAVLGYFTYEEYNKTIGKTNEYKDNVISSSEESKNNDNTSSNKTDMSLFQLSLKKMISASETTYQSEKLTIDGLNHNVYSVEGIISSSTAYYGCIVMSNDGSGNAENIYVMDSEYASIGSSVEGIEKYDFGATKIQVFRKGFINIPKGSYFNDDSRLPITVISTSNKEAIKEGIINKCGLAYNTVTGIEEMITFDE